MEESKRNKIRSVRDLEAYRKAFDAAMEIDEISKGFPDDTYEHIFAMLNNMERKADTFCT